MRSVSYKTNHSKSQCLKTPSIISHDCSLAELPGEGLPLLYVAFGEGGLTKAEESRWPHSRLVPPAGLAGPLPFMWSLIIQSLP